MKYFICPECNGYGYVNNSREIEEFDVTMWVIDHRCDEAHKTDPKDVKYAVD